MAATSKLIQDAIVAFLKTIPVLAGVPVIGRRKGNITNDIEAAVSAIGACIYVFPALPVDVNPNLPGPYADKMEIRVRVIEAPSINTTLPDAYELTEFVLTFLNQKQLEGVDGLNPISCTSKPVEEIQDDNQIFDITFTTSVGLPAQN